MLPVSVLTFVEILVLVTIFAFAEMFHGQISVLTTVSDFATDRTVFPNFDYKKLIFGRNTWLRQRTRWAKIACGIEYLFSSAVICCATSFVLTSSVHGALEESDSIIWYSFESGFTRFYFRICLILHNCASQGPYFVLKFYMDKTTSTSKVDSYRKIS